MMRDAIAWGYLDASPIARLSLPQPERKRITPLAPEQTRRLLDAAAHFSQRLSTLGVARVLQSVATA